MDLKIIYKWIGYSPADGGSGPDTLCGDNPVTDSCRDGRSGSAGPWAGAKVGMV